MGKIYIRLFGKAARIYEKFPAGMKKDLVKHAVKKNILRKEKILQTITQLNTKKKKKVKITVDEETLRLIEEIPKGQRSLVISACLVLEYSQLVENEEDEEDYEEEIRFEL